MDKRNDGGKELWITYALVFATIKQSTDIVKQHIVSTKNITKKPSHQTIH